VEEKRSTIVEVKLSARVEAIVEAKLNARVEAIVEAKSVLEWKL
jgi:hypothetical protein